MIDQMRLFRASLGFLSIVPAGGVKLSRSQLGRSATYFPAVGLIIGFAGMALALALDKVFPGQATNAVIVLYLAVVTGGLHLDALADTADGFMGGKTKTARLRIMRQGASGPLGVAAVTLVLLLKYAFLTSLAGSPRLIAILIVPGLARWPMVFMARYLPAARRSGLGFIFATETRTIDVLGAGFFAGVLVGYAAWILGPLEWALAPVLVLAAFVGARISAALIGGATGDTLGAVVEPTEAALLLTMSVLVRYV